MATFMNTETFFISQTHIVKKKYSKSAPLKPLRYPTILNNFEGDEERKFFQFLSIVGFGLLSERTEGQVASIDFASEGLLSSFNYTSWALQYEVTKEAAREDAARLIPKLPALLRYSSDQTKENLFWLPFNLAFSTAPGCALADGQPLCSTVHPLTGVPGATYSNMLGAVALTVETLHQSQVLMSVIPDDRGLLTYRTMQDLIYPPGYHKTVVETLSSYYYPTTNENKVNAMAGSLEPHAIEYLQANFNGPFPWFVLAGKSELGSDGHTVFATVKWDEQNSYYDKKTQSMFHGTEFRAAWGSVDGRGVVGSSGA
jgi:hypothetical protein